MFFLHDFITLERMYRVKQNWYSGKEQISIGVRYSSEHANGWKNKEEFLGFVELSELHAEAFATAILELTNKIRLDMSKLVGLGFNGCSTMGGKENGVQRRFRKEYLKAVFFHCASHKFNLVINDLNTVPEIRNTIGTVQEIIKFFRESVLRRKLLPNLPFLCETTR